MHLEDILVLYFGISLREKGARVDQLDFSFVTISFVRTVFSLMLIVLTFPCEYPLQLMFSRHGMAFKERWTRFSYCFLVRLDCGVCLYNDFRAGCGGLYIGVHWKFQDCVTDA